MSWINNKQSYVDILERLEPAARIVSKDHWFWSALWWAATVTTFGLFALGMERRVFLESYATTLFPIQAYPSSWLYLPTRLLVHECRHTTHCVWLGYAVPLLGWIPGRTGRHIRAWCGAPLYAVLYLLFVFPVVFGAGRLLIELDADRASWRWMLEGGWSSKAVEERAEKFGSTVCSGHYLWPWLRALGGVKLFSWAARRVIAAHQRASSRN